MDSLNERLQKAIAVELDPVVCGVYLLLCRGVCVYVGQSKNVYARIRHHHSHSVSRPRDRNLSDCRPGTQFALRFDSHCAASGGRIEFDEATYIECSEGELLTLEALYMGKFKPHYNTQYQITKSQSILAKHTRP